MIGTVIVTTLLLWVCLVVIYGVAEGAAHLAVEVVECVEDRKAKKAGK